MPTLKFRRSIALDWSARNPVLANGEPGYETDTNKLKVGNGRDPWNDLEYFAGDAGEYVPPTEGELALHINADEPHPVYDDGPSLFLLYENAKV